MNLAQRLQQLAAGGQTILSEPTARALASPVNADVLPPTTVKGRHTPVTAYRLAATASATPGAGP